MVILRTFTAHHAAVIQRAWRHRVNLPKPAAPNAEIWRQMMIMNGAVPARRVPSSSASAHILYIACAHFLRRNMRASTSTTKV